MNFLSKILLTILIICSPYILASQCNPLNDLLGSFVVAPGDDTCIEINIEKLENNDLASNNGILGIDLDFSHNNVSELLIELTSPSGQTVVIIGDITSGFPTNGSTWNILFAECAGGAVPDPGIINENWENSDNWTVSTNFTGIYYPHIGCLEDFNSGPINGVWKLRVLNTSSFETAIIERVGFTIENDVCSPCLAEAGSQNVSDLTICTNEDLNLDLELSGQNSDVDYTTAYFITAQDGTFVINLDSDFSNLAAGDYTICAFSILSADLSLLLSQTSTFDELIVAISDGTLPICIDLSDNCTSLTLIQGPAVMTIDRTICMGSNISIGNDIYDTEGTFSALLPKMDGDLCDTNVILTLQVIDIEPIIQSSAPEFNCTNPIITLDASLSRQSSGSDWFWSTLDGQIISNPNLSSIEISSPGTYTLAQSEDGCTLETSFTISQAGDVPQVSINSDNLSCTVENVMLIITSSATFNSAVWEGPSGFTSTTLEPMVSIPGLYTVTLTSTAGCIVSISYNLLQGSDQPTISAEAVNISCANSNVQITVDNDTYTAYRWTGPGGFTSNLPEPTVTLTGEYFLEVQDENGCKGFTSLEILGDENTFDYEVSGEDFQCEGGRATISASSEVDNAVYSWTGPNDYFSSSPSNQVAAVGTYYLEIIANGCVVSDSVVIIRDISDLPEYDVQVENIGDCQNPLWRLTAIPIANEFQTSMVRWGISGVSFIGEGSQIDVSEVGSYFLYINSFNGCVIIERFTITPISNAPTIALLSKTNVTCTEGRTSGIIQVTDNPDYTYSWEGPDGFTNDTSLIENLAGGFYTLTATDVSTGCISFFETRIIGDTIPRTVSFINTDINCDNSTARIITTANGAGNTYEWAGPEGTLTTKDLDVTTAGNYVLTVTGGNGCLTIDSLEVISDIEPPAFSLLDTILDCTTQSAELNPNTSEPGLIYLWNGPDNFSTTSANPTVFATGEYNLTITGLNGCISEGSIEISTNLDTPMPIAAASDTLNCFNTEVLLTGQAAIPVESYSWNGPSSFISSEQNPIVSDPGEYVLTIESSQGCIGFDTVHVVQEIILPAVSFAFDNTIDCIDNTATLTAVSADPGTTFLWTGPNGFSEEGMTAMATDTGTYIYYVRGANNCVDSDTFNITTEEIDLTTDNTITCFQPTIDITELSDSVSFSIIWTQPDGSTSSETNLVPAEQGTYTAIFSGNNGCMANVSVEVSIDTISPTTAINQVGLVRCEIDEITLNNTGSSMGPEYHNLWSTSDGNIMSDSSLNAVNIDGVGQYTLMVIDSSNGCRTETMYQVVAEPQEFSEIDLSFENPRCFGENNGFISFNNGLGGTAPYSFSIDGVLFSSDSIIGGLAPGDYTFIAKDSFGCIVENMVTIVETEALELDLGDNIDVFLGNEVEISASTNLSTEQIESIRWQIENQFGCADCLSFTLTPSNDLLVELTLTDDRGCTITDNVQVRVDQTPVLFKPNIFSPNEDGVNDMFFISANQGVASFRSMAIFDRWGTKVFESRNTNPGDSESGWDGKLDGQNVLPGVYVYKLEVEMITGATVPVKGDVTVVR